MRIGTLARLAIRDVWPCESRDFTPWLAANLDALCPVVQKDLMFVSTELRRGAVAEGAAARPVRQAGALADGRVAADAVGGCPTCGCSQACHRADTGRCENHPTCRWTVA